MGAAKMIVWREKKDEDVEKQGVLVWQMTNGGVSFSCAWEPAYVTMLMRCNGENPAC